MGGWFAARVFPMLGMPQFGSPPQRMPDETPPSPTDLAARIAQLEARLARLEAYVEIDDAAAEAPAIRALRTRTEAELEYVVGQTWFARFGIIALAAGGGFLLTLPYPDVPAAAPAVAGFGVAAGLFLVAHLGRHAFALVSSYLRGAAMALFYCATLRLSFFGAHAVLPREAVAAHALATGVAALNLAIAWRRRSPFLFALALLIATSVPVMFGDSLTVLTACAVLPTITALAAARARWQPLLPISAALVFAAYGSWAMGNPLVGGQYHWTSEPAWAPLFLLLTLAIIGATPLLGRNGTPDEPAPGVAALVNCLFGYGLFLVHTYAIQAPRFALLHGFASALLLALAAGLWLRHRSTVATFFYAMTAYAALMMAIIHLTTLPDVFVWLSVESVMVVATAIWFRSRFIVVTNFLIYGFVVLGYMVLSTHETGVSIGFGLVALVSARVLNWQRHRLELKTELMRNAYLLSAFVVFPYALFHLVPTAYTAVAWIALALVYYALNFVIRNQKYRWMGHGTLVLTTVYLIVPGHAGFSVRHRVASLLVLGAVLLVVSLLFTRGRNAQPARTDAP